MNLDLATPMTAILSVSLLGFTGVSSVVTVLQGPPIVGSAVYSKVVQPGETVLLKWTLHKRNDCPGTNSRVWSGANGFHLTEAAKRNTIPVTDSPIQPVIPTAIPRYAPPGELRLTIEGECVRQNAAALPFKLGPVFFEVTP